MNQHTFRTLIILILFFLSACATHETSDKKTSDIPVFQDDFSTKDSNWYWRIDHSAVCTLVTSGVEFKVLGIADTLDYSNAEIYESAGRLPWLRNRAVFRLQSPSIQVGSRGWGFWNGSMNMSTSVMAWFARVEGTGNTVSDGFYASTQNYGNAPFMTEITGVDLSQWHEFEINWKADSVVYSIDGNVVVTHSFSPDRNMRLDVWTDNAVYDSSWAHVFQDLSADSTLIIDWIKLY
jgi:hypothetical protein